MGKEDVRLVPGAESPIPGQKVVRLPFVKVGDIDEIGRITNPETYEKVIELLTDTKSPNEQGAKDAKWFIELIKDVKAGKKTALVEAGAGILTFFVAAAAGYEFGIRKGEDLRSWADKMKKIKKRLQKRETK